MTVYPFVTWRLLHSAPTGGATNMAVDEAVARTAAKGQVPPTLRLYAWEPACLSLGRGQPVTDVDCQALKAAGLGLVRRPTGGGAIFHVDELTYSVIAPETEVRVAGGIVESYRRLSAGLMRGLEQLGVADLAADKRAADQRAAERRAENRRLKGPVCFESPSDYEITTGGRKLVGSAQMRSRGVVLQHGTVPLHGDIARICPLLAARPDPARVRARAATVAETLGRTVTWSEVAGAVAAGFAEALNIHLEPGALTDEERAWVEKLRAEKYATDEWTHRVW